MAWSGSLPAVSRRALVIGALATALAATTAVQAQTGQAQTQPPAQQQPQQDPLKFNFDGPMLLVWQIKPDRAAGFEQAWLTIKGALAKHDKPEVKAFGDTWTISKVEQTTPDPAGPVVYIFNFSPVSKTFSYNPAILLFETLKAPTPDPAVTPPPPPPPGTFTYDEAKAIFEKINESWVPTGGIVPWPLKKVG